MQAVPEEIEQVSAAMADLRDILGDVLLAVYLHGSAVSGGLRPQSDIDLLAVVDRGLTGGERDALLSSLLRLSGRHPAVPGGGRCPEIMVFTRSDLADNLFPARAEFVYGEWLRDAFEAGETPMPAQDPEFTMVLALARQDARALFGPDRNILLPEISEVSDGVDAPRRHRCAMVAGVEAPLRRGASMGEVGIIGLDLAKNVFQAHGAGADGSVIFRRKLSRAQLLKFMAAQPPCVVAMEACASAHHWGRAISDLGHQVRLIPPAYVKPFVKRQKNDMADAEAIAEAASRPTMRFVAVKSEAQQAAAMAYRTRDLLVRQRTQTINALRAHLAEQGIVAPAGLAHVGRLAAIIDGDDGMLPAAVRDLARLLLDQIAGLAEKIAGLDAELRKRVTTDDTARRLTTIPGVGVVTAAAITPFAPPMETFSKGRDFAAWVGLTPRQHSSGGKDRLGRTSKMGQRDIRRLLIVGAVAVVRWAARKGAPGGSWLGRMMARKPKMLVAVALANRMARTAWALLRKGEDYRDPAMAAA